jgi:Glutathione S-transferase, N-terminal domain
MAHPIVYGPAGSTYVWSARLALAEKGVTHELVEVPLGTHRQEPHLSRQPFAKVPAFEHDGFALYETQAMMRYVDERFAGTPLQPEDVHEWSRMNQIIGIVDAYVWPSIAGAILFNRVLVPRLLGGAPDEAAIAAALPRARPHGGPPVPYRRPCQPCRFDGDPAALLLRQCPGRPRANGGAPEIAELGQTDGNAAELPGDQAPSVLSWALIRRGRSR